MTPSDETRVVPLTEHQRRELERRLAEDDANPDDLIPWDEVKRKAIERLGLIAPAPLATPVRDPET